MSLRGYTLSPESINKTGIFIEVASLTSVWEREVMRQRSVWAGRERNSGATLPRCVTDAAVFPGIFRSAQHKSSRSSGSKHQQADWPSSSIATTSFPACRRKLVTIVAYSCSLPNFSGINPTHTPPHERGLIIAESSPALLLVRGREIKKVDGTQHALLWC